MNKKKCCLPDIRISGQQFILISGYQEIWNRPLIDLKGGNKVSWYPDIRISGKECRLVSLAFSDLSLAGCGRPLAFCLNGKEEGAVNPRGDLSSKNSAIPQLWRAPLKKRANSSEGSTEAMAISPLSDFLPSQSMGQTKANNSTNMFRWFDLCRR